jgi:hypothetical protein
MKWFLLVLSVVGVSAYARCGISLVLTGSPYRAGSFAARSARLSEFTRDSIPYWYLRLAQDGKLVSQDDPVFYRRGLSSRRNDSSLCATTCPLNSITAAMARFSQSTNIPKMDLLMDFLIERNRDISRGNRNYVDPTQGTAAHLAGSAAKAAWEMAVDDMPIFDVFRIEHEVVSIGDITPENISRILRDPNAIVEAGTALLPDLTSAALARAVSSRSLDVRGHAINILAINTGSREIAISDPHDQNAVVWLPYSKDKFLGYPVITFTFADGKEDKRFIPELSVLRFIPRNAQSSARIDGPPVETVTRNPEQTRLSDLLNRLVGRRARIIWQDERQPRQGTYLILSYEDGSIYVRQGAREFYIHEEEIRSVRAL